MDERIQGKVAEIIDEYTVVINRGYKHGVEEGMQFVIYELCKEIKDPDTGEVLGQWERIKAKVEVINVQEKISMTKIPDRLQVLLRGLAMLTNEEPKAELQSGLKSPIKIGDLAKQTLD